MVIRKSYRRKSNRRRTNIRRSNRRRTNIRRSNRRRTNIRRSNRRNYRKRTRVRRTKRPYFTKKSRRILLGGMYDALQRSVSQEQRDREEEQREERRDELAHAAEMRAYKGLVDQQDQQRQQQGQGTRVENPIAAGTAAGGGGAGGGEALGRTESASERAQEVAATWSGKVAREKNQADGEQIFEASGQEEKVRKAELRDICSDRRGQTLCEIDDQCSWEPGCLSCIRPSSGKCVPVLESNP